MRDAAGKCQGALADETQQRNGLLECDPGAAADAFKRARSTDPKALAEAIRQTNIAVASRMSLGGPIKFNPKGQVEGNLSAAIQNLKGRPSVTLPAEFAEAKVIFPSPDYKKA